MRTLLSVFVLCCLFFSTSCKQREDSNLKSVAFKESILFRLKKEAGKLEPVDNAAVEQSNEKYQYYYDDNGNKIRGKVVAEIILVERCKYENSTATGCVRLPLEEISLTNKDAVIKLLDSTEIEILNTNNASPGLIKQFDDLNSVFLTKFPSLENGKQISSAQVFLGGSEASFTANGNFIKIKGTVDYDQKYSVFYVSAAEGKVGLVFKLNDEAKRKKLEEDLRQAATLPPADRGSWTKGQCAFNGQFKFDPQTGAKFVEKTGFLVFYVKENADKFDFTCEGHGYTRGGGGY